MEIYLCCKARHVCFYCLLLVAVGMCRHLHLICCLVAAAVCCQLESLGFAHVLLAVLMSVSLADTCPHRRWIQLDAAALTAPCSPQKMRHGR